VDGEAAGSGRRVECDELTHHALVGMGGNASLSEGAAGGKEYCGEGHQVEELSSIVHGNLAVLVSKKDQFWLQKDGVKD
jgi:hypothetical protein